jgi:uncharacterized protein
MLLMPSSRVLRTRSVFVAAAAAVFLVPSIASPGISGAALHAAGAARLPEPGGWVNDFAGCLDQENRERLFELCVELEHETTAELTVVTIGSLGGESVESYTSRLFNHWGVGKRDQNNGVMLLFAMQDRRMRIGVGDGLTSVLPDALCQRIIDDTIVPHFKAERYGDGAYAGAARIAEVLSEHYSRPLETLRTHRPRREGPLSKIGRWIGGLIKSLGIIILVPIYLILRLLFGRSVGLPWPEGGGSWSSGWGGSGGFGGGSTSGGGASGSW